MNVPIIQNILQQQILESIFLVDIQCQLYGILITREHVKNTINFEKKKRSPLRKDEIRSHQDAKVCYVCEKRFLKTFANDKNYPKVRDHCHYAGKYKGAADSICNLKLNVPNEIPVVFHNGFIIILL